jgi:hypothetical protein
MTVRAPAFDALDFEAPFLIEKLLKDRIADTSSDAEALFTEVKRYLVLSMADDSSSWHMYSARIDECWHQLVLFTRQYMEFCQQYFGRYVPHNPSNAPMTTSAATGRATTFQQFQDRYDELFGIPLPDVWYDERHVTTRTRVLNDGAGMLALREHGGMVELVTPLGDILVSVNELARDALAFLARTGAFYVRELPGELDDEERVALIATLVQYRLLRLAP